jgi:uncharacterized membrane protein YsdA (DUF1294 family)
MDLRIAVLAVVAAYLGAINVVAFHVFAHDKLESVGRRRRTPERTLLALTAFGGALGAVAARWLFRHKTKKQPFRILFWIIVAAQATLVADVVWSAWR